MLDEIDFGIQIVEGRERVNNVYMKNYQLIVPDGTLDSILELHSLDEQHD